MLNIRFKFLITVLVIPVILANQLDFIDNASSEYTESGLKRTLVTYAVARGLNGVISVAQGTEVAIEPAGIGLTFTPGQILDPVNDLIERFSWVVLVSGTSLGVQELLLSVSSFHVLRYRPQRPLRLGRSKMHTRSRRYSRNGYSVSSLQSKPSFFSR